MQCKSVGRRNRYPVTSTSEGAAAGHFCLSVQGNVLRAHVLEGGRIRTDFHRPFHLPVPLPSTGYYGQRLWNLLVVQPRVCGCMGRKVVTLTCCFPGQGQLADKSCQNALGRMSAFHLCCCFLRLFASLFFHLSFCLLSFSLWI